MAIAAILAVTLDPALRLLFTRMKEGEAKDLAALRAHLATSPVAQHEAIVTAVARVRPTDPRRALRLDGAAALAGLMDDRTAAAAFRTVDRLHASLSDFADPPGRVLVVIAHVAMRRARSPAEAQQLLERVLARKPYPPPPNASHGLMPGLACTGWGCVATTGSYDGT